MIAFLLIKSFLSRLMLQQVVNIERPEMKHDAHNLILSQYNFPFCELCKALRDEELYFRRRFSSIFAIKIISEALHANIIKVGMISKFRRMKFIQNPLPTSYLNKPFEKEPLATVRAAKREKKDALKASLKSLS